MLAFLLGITIGIWVGWFLAYFEVVDIKPRSKAKAEQKQKSWPNESYLKDDEKDS